MDFLCSIKKNSKKEDKLRKNLKKLIRKTLELTLEGVPEKLSKIYERFSQIAKNNASSVITFNWDMLLDRHFIFNYGSDKIKPKSGSRSAQVSAPLLKLHGSLNWITPKNKNDDILYGGIKIPEESSDDPLIVLPSYQKFSGEKNTPSALGQIWEKALQEISSADQIFIIGFSFPETDPHFNLFLRYALKQNIQENSNKTPRIYVITRPKRLVRDKMEFEDRYKKVLENQTGIMPRFYYITFSKYVDLILTPDHLKRREQVQEMEKLLTQVSS